MDDSNTDTDVNGSQTDVKQNCVENNAVDSLPPPSDTGKKTSFEITSITEPNIDDNDEDSPDTDPETKTDTKQEIDLQSYADSMLVYNTTNDLDSSAPVIPTSSQYGLAFVDNSESGLSVGSIKSEDIQSTDSCLQKSECDLNGVQNKNRNERFKVVKIESTEPFKRGRWVCMDFLDHSMNQQQQQQQQPGKIAMVNGDNATFSQANDLDMCEQPLDNGHHESSDIKVSTNNVSTYTTNCNTTDNNKNQTSTYNMVSSGVTTPIHSACVSPGQSLKSNIQVPVQTSQPVAVTSVHTNQPQSLTQVQLPTQHNINQSCMPPHSSLQSHQLQQVIASAGVIQPQLQQTQPVINVVQNQNSTIQPQSIQHLNSVEQHVTQTMPQQYQQPLSQANLQQQQIMQHNMSAQFQKSFVSQNQSALPNCPPLQQSVNQLINQQVPQYYNSQPVQSQNVTSEPSTTVPMSNQHISQQQFQSLPIQNHVQLQQNQQQLPPPVQQMQQHSSSQQNMVQQNPMQSQMVQQNQQLSHQPSISQPNQPPQIAQQHIQQSQQASQPQQTHVQQVPSSQQQQQQQPPQQMQQVSQQIQPSQGSQIQQQLSTQQSHHITQLTQMNSQPQQISQSNQMQQIAQQSQQISQQITLQTQQIPQQTQMQSQQMNQQQISQQQHISQIAGQNQMVHQNNQQITHTGQIISQQNLNQGQQLNQQQNQQQIQQPNQSMSQQIIQPNQSIPQQNQVLPQQLGISQSNSQMSVSQNQQVIQSQHNMQQSGQQYQPPQQMMAQPQQLPMQANQPIMHQPPYSQAQSLNAMQLQQVQMSSMPTNTVTSTQMHIQQQQPVAQANMMQPSQINVMSQNNIQPTVPMSQQQMTYSLQQHVPINPNYVNSMQNCYMPSQQQMPPYNTPLTKTVETASKKIEDNNSEDIDNGTTNGSGTTTVAIDNKIEQAMDLVKSHLMYAVREEVEILKEKIAELMDKVGQLETENSNLRMLVPQEMLEQYNREKQKPTNGQSSHNQ